MLEAIDIARPPVLAPTSLFVASGEMAGLIGPNGAGKTSLMRALAGITPGPGAVMIGAEPLSAIPPRLRPARLAYMPAVRRIDWPMPVRDVVALGLPDDAPNVTAAVHQALAATDSLGFADTPIDQLSTGERARVLLARAIVGQPACLLLDEPVANLDPYYQLHIMALLRQRTDQGAAVLIAIHDLGLARRMCDRLLLIDEGRIIASGTPDEVLTPDNLSRAFRVAPGLDGGWQMA